MYILKPDIEEEQYAQEIARFEELVNQEGGQVEGIDEWGKRTLAYEIRHYDQGYYVLMNFNFDPTKLPQLEERFKLDDVVLRHQIVRLDEEE
jgi:small subunit ribosomal protein S6